MYYSTHRSNGNGSNVVSVLNQYYANNKGVLVGLFSIPLGLSLTKNIASAT